MNYKEAYNEFTTTNNTLTTECEELIDEALKKQISSTPILIAMKGFDFEVAAELCCPNCKEPIHSDFIKPFEPKYCRECGQKLYWGK